MYLKRLGLAFSICFVLFACSFSFTHAHINPPVKDINIGDSVTLGNQQFVKVNNNGLLMMTGTYACPDNRQLGGQWIKCLSCPAESSYSATLNTCECQTGTYDMDTNSCLQCPVGYTYSQTLQGCFEAVNCDNPVGYMDTWKGCSELTNFATACLVDPRDLRTYRVRGIDDGKCWMIDSLKFGGNYLQKDGCMANNGEGNTTYAWCGGEDAPGCTAGGSFDSTKARDQFSPGYYGHCRYVGEVDGVTYDNYVYDWVAAIQDPYGYQGGTVTYNGYHQGICAPGWHLPLGGNNGDFQTLANLHGTLPNNFWIDSQYFAATCSGGANATTVGEQNDKAFYWSSTQYISTRAYGLEIRIPTSVVISRNHTNKDFIIAVRCVQDLTISEASNCEHPIGYMTTWDGCDSLSEFDTVCLLDPRDYKTYRVRKFADNQCWMIDSLKFGGNYGDTDGCAAFGGEGNFTYAWCGGSGVEGCTRGGANSLAKAQETFASGFYGHCRQNTTDYTYLYDWVATTQNTLAYAGSSTTFSGTQQGLCPSGWHLPLGGSSGDYQNLANLYGTATSSFWFDANSFNGSLTGSTNAIGALTAQGQQSFYSSSTAYDTNNVHRLHLTSSAVNPAGNPSTNNKQTGLSIRCIRD
ncbi:hypothetical protein IJJ27_02920 [bacterium]|nr:hypothetical protein [bacterium]